MLIYFHIICTPTGGIQGSRRYPQPDGTLQEITQTPDDGQLLPEAWARFLEVWQWFVPCLRFASSAAVVTGTEEEHAARRNPKVGSLLIGWAENYT